MPRPKLNHVCAACDSTTTYINKQGYATWYHFDGNILCSKCWRNYVYNPFHHPIDNPIHNKRQIQFKGKSIYLGINPRKGQCSKCGLKLGDFYINALGRFVRLRRTFMHHIQYHEDDPLKDTIELCPLCHGAQHKRK